MLALVSDSRKRASMLRLAISRPPTVMVPPPSSRLRPLPGRVVALLEARLVARLRMLLPPLLKVVPPKAVVEPSLPACHWMPISAALFGADLGDQRFHIHLGAAAVELVDDLAQVVVDGVRGGDDQRVAHRVGLD